MADVTTGMDAEHAASLRRRYLIQFEEDTLRPRPLWIRLIPARTLGPDIVGNDYTGWWIYILEPVIGAAIAVAIIGAVRDCRTRRSGRRPKAAPFRLAAPPPRTATEKAGKLRLDEVPGISVQLTCLIGVAAACDTA